MEAMPDEYGKRITLKRHTESNHQAGVRIGGIALRRWPGWRPEREVAVAEEVRRAAYGVIRRKGATNHAIGLVTAALLRWSLRGTTPTSSHSSIHKRQPIKGYLISDNYN